MLQLHSKVMLVFPRIPHQLNIFSRKCAFLSTSSCPDSVAPPKKRHRDSISVLRALASCVDPCLSLPHYWCLHEPWMSSQALQRTFIQSKASGRLAARHVARYYFPNDLVAQANEVPRIDALLPLQTSEYIRKELAEGKITVETALRRLILLLDAKEAWSLYSKYSSSEKFTAEMEQDLLELLCGTNSGFGGSDFFENLDFRNLGDLPDPTELYYATENRFVATRFAKTRLPARRKEEEISDTETSSESSETSTDDDSSDSDKSHLTTWCLSSPAELLWSQRKEVLSTISGYSSMIRGSARFKNPERSWALFQETLNSPQLSHLSLSAFNALLHCSCELKEAKASGDVWPKVLTILERLRNLKIQPQAQTFTSALYSIGQFSRNMGYGLRPSAGHSVNYAGKALGLLEEMKALQLKPTLGTYANLLQTLRNTVVSTDPTFKSKYRLADLLSDIIVSLEREWLLNPPSRDGVYTKEDYSFASIAMDIASLEASIGLVSRVYDLIHSKGDRRFLFQNSIAARSFYDCYFRSNISLYKVPKGPNMEVESVQHLVGIYKSHRSIMLNSQQLIYLIRRLERPITHWRTQFEHLRRKTTTNPSIVDLHRGSDLYIASSLALTELAGIVFDSTAQISKPLTKLLTEINEIIKIFSACDIWEELPPRPGDSPLRLFTEEAARAGSTAAAGLLEKLSAFEGRPQPGHSFPSPQQTASLVGMLLNPVAFNTAPLALQTVSQRETNETSIGAASSLLLLSKRLGVLSDTGAMHIIRALWFSSREKFPDNAWCMFEYLSEIKSFSQTFLEDHFLDQFRGILNKVEESFAPPSSPNYVSTLSPEESQLANKSTPHNHLIIRALNRRLSISQGHLSATGSTPTKRRL